MEAGMTFVKYLLFFFNFIFAVTGIAILSVGAVIKSDYSTYEDLLDGKYFSTPGFLIAVGVIVFIVAFFGCWGAWKDNYCMVVTYASLLIIIFIFELAGGIAGYVLRDDVKTYLENNLNATLGKTNENPNMMKLWNVIQSDLECCGFESAEDWYYLRNATAPETCCENHAIHCNTTLLVAPNPEIYNSSCLNALEHFLEDKASTIGGVGIGIAFVQLVGVIFAVCLARDLKRKFEYV